MSVDLHDGHAGTARFLYSLPEICAEEMTYDAAFAAVPCLMDFAGRLDASDADEYLIVAGLIATLKTCKNNADLRYLLASVAAMRGRTDLAAVLQDLDAIQEPCTTCGTVVYPSELQAVERDRSS